MVKVSVIVTAYNIEDYITRCLNSLIYQSLEDIEIIVVNDGSTDKTKLYIEQVGNSDERIKIVNKKNSGPGEARKSGLNIARGNYIVFIDGDDWIDLKALEKLYNKAVEENVDIVLFNYYLVYPENFIARKSYNDNMYKFNDNIKSALLCAIAPSMWCKFIKHRFLLENKVKLPGNLSYAEDLASIVKLFIYQPEVTVLENNLYYYFQRENSITKKLDYRVFDIPNAVTCIKESLLESGLYEKYKAEFEYLAYTHIFYNKVICTNDYISIHKRLNKAWKEQKIIIKNNQYFKTLKKNSSFGLKTKINLFNYNYTVGLLYSNLWKMLKV